MVDSISKELFLQSEYIADETIESIYFGGGTPSILAASELERILSSAKSHYVIADDAEITLEANPDDLTSSKLHELKSLGINRLSIGIQSFNPKTLNYLNRAHNAEEAIESVNQARNSGFDNLSLDLIFAIPGHSIENVDSDIAQVAQLNPEHVSVYGLTIEERTVFGNWHKKGALEPTSEIDAADQFELIIATLENHGFEQYEISNFCRKKKYSKHNSSYWKNVKYLGVGPGAHSFNGNSRQYNISNNQLYINAIDKSELPCDIEILDAKSQANEYLLTTLRTKWGCSLDVLQQEYNYPLDLKGKILPLINAQLIYQAKDKIFLTKKGKFVADSIIQDLFWV